MTPLASCRIARALSKTTLALALAVGLAGCGGGTSSSGTGEKPGATPQSTIPRGADTSPGPAVRAFLDAYRSGDAKVACTFVTSSFSRPGDRKARPPESCTRQSKAADDLLTRHMLIVDTDPKPPVARVLTKNTKGTLLVFRLVHKGAGWRIESVGTQKKRGHGKPKLPPAKD